MTESADDISAAGVDILALTVDGVQDNRAAELKDAQGYLDRIGFPFESGLATLDLLDKLRLTQLPFVEATTISGMPTSFLIKADGNLAAIYKGPIDPAQLIADVDKIRNASSNSPDLGVSFPGRWFGGPETHNQLVTLAAHFLTQGYPNDSLIYSASALALDPTSEIALRNRDLATADVTSWAAQVAQWRQRVDTEPNDTDARFNLAAAYRNQREYDHAIAQLTEVVRIDESLVKAHQQLGFLLAREGELDAAEKHLKRVLSVEPANQAARANLKTITEARKGRKRESASN